MARGKVLLLETKKESASVPWTADPTQMEQKKELK
jgi:hypothetical protein